MAAFSEANLLWGSETNEFISRVETAVRLGYHTLLLNNSVHDALKNKKKGKDKRDAVQITKASEVKIPEEKLTDLQQRYGRQIHQYSRFSTVVEDPGQTHKLQSDRDVQSYDIIAVEPTSEKTFQLACLTLDVDIITLDFTQRLPFYFKRSHINVAIERGVHFEIVYSPAIRDAHARRYTISNALSLMRVCKGKNIILSGGCEKAIEFRGPYDIANLGILFGMTEAQARDALSTNVRALIMHAKARKTTGTAIKLAALKGISDEDAWKVRETRMAEDQDDSSESEESDEGNEEPSPKKQKT